MNTLGLIVGCGALGGLVVLIAYTIIEEYQKHRAWKQKHAERERVYQFWKTQCHQSQDAVNAAFAADDPDAYESALEAHWNNLRRYERDVLGKD